MANVVLRFYRGSHSAAHSEFIIGLCLPLAVTTGCILTGLSA